MIPQNDIQTPPKELSWIDRMQLKLESFYETEAVRSPNNVVQETSAYFEKQMTTVGTNMRKFCAEFVKEILLPDSPEVGPLQADLGQSNALLSGAEKPIKSAKVLDGDAPVFNPEASISGSALEEVPLDHITDAQDEQEAAREGPPSEETSEVPVVKSSAVLPKDEEQDQDTEQEMQQTLLEGDEQYAHWLVNEEFRDLTLGKSCSYSSLENVDGMERTPSRTPSTDSLNDWELI